MKKKQTMEDVVHGVFLLLGLVTVGCVLLITVYLILSGLPAITKIGLGNFLFGTEWASTASDPKYGILPFILTSVYGTCGAILLGVPVGFLTAVFLSKMAPKKLRSVMESAVSLLAGIPSVVYGLVGMLVLVPGIRKLFHVPDGASLLAAMVVLAIMILPSIIKVSVNALDAVPKEYEDASLALGATPVETWFRVSAPAARSGIAAAVVLGVGRAIGEAMAIIMVAGNVAKGIPGARDWDDRMAAARQRRSPHTSWYFSPCSSVGLGRTVMGCKTPTTLMLSESSPSARGSNVLRGFIGLIPIDVMSRNTNLFSIMSIYFWLKMFMMASITFSST